LVLRQKSRIFLQKNMDCIDFGSSLGFTTKNMDCIDFGSILDRFLDGFGFTAIFKKFYNSDLFQKKNH